VQPEQWTWSTPCSEWNVRQLVNHMAGGNINYVHLLEGGTAEEFLRQREADVLGADPITAYVRSVQSCAAAFAEPSMLNRLVDYPLGTITGRQALAVRITDTTIHTWDLARAIGGDEHLDNDLVAWIDDHLEVIYAGLAETPTAAGTTHRFFASPHGGLTDSASRQTRLLDRMGRALRECPFGRPARRWPAAGRRAGLEPGTTAGQQVRDTRRHDRGDED